MGYKALEKIEILPSDIASLIDHVPTPELIRYELKSARKSLKGAVDRSEQECLEWYIELCNQALMFLRKPKAKDDPLYKESIDELKERYNLVEYIGQYVELEQSGNKYQGLCPFHNDKKSKSLFVWDNSSWYCFGCQKGGTIIDFVMEYFDEDIKSSIKRLRNE